MTKAIVELLGDGPNQVFAALEQGDGAFDGGPGGEGCEESLAIDASGPWFEERDDCSALGWGEFFAGGSQVADEVGTAGLVDPGAIGEVEAVGGEGDDFGEYALLVADPHAEAVAELIAVVADTVAADDFVLVDIGAEGGELEEERPVGERLEGLEDGAGLEVGVAA